jgi:hypothetical protein
LVTDKRQAVKVEVPGTQDDSVKFGRVGIIAVVGFAIGIVWPRLAGVKLVPSVPVPAAAEASARELTGAPLETKPAAVPTPAAPSAAPPDKPPAERLLVSDVQVASCRNEHGKRAQSCDRVDFDRVAREPLRSLASCPGTDDAAGVLSLGFDLDFEGDKIKNIQSGKSTSLEQDNVDRLLACARERFANVSLQGIAHEQTAYTLYYRLELLGAAAPSSARPNAAETGGAHGSGSDEGTPASGHATVSWDVALVRAQPARDGEVRARVLSGTRVVVTGKNGDWFRIKYDAKGSQGWVYRTAIGM